MQTPQYSTLEFLDNLTLNAAAGNVSGSLATLASGVLTPGLLYPNAATYAISGFQITANLNAPFGVLFGTGVLSQAFGTNTGQNTQTYTVNFSGLVPSSGPAVTGYVLASYASIQQTPKQIIGPQPGHPDYNAQFAPYVAYTVNVDSIALSASTTAPDNQSTFEVARCLLTSGAVTVSGFTTAYQISAYARNSTAIVLVSGAAYSITPFQAGQTFYVTSGITVQLPAVSGLNGSIFNLIAATSGTVTIQVSGTDVIKSAFGNPTSGTTQIQISNYQDITLTGTLGSWTGNSSITEAEAQNYIFNNLVSSGYIPFAQANFYWNGSSVVTNSSYGISSINKENVGIYQFSFTSSGASAIYAYVNGLSLPEFNAGGLPGGTLPFPLLSGFYQLGKTPIVYFIGVSGLSYNGNTYTFIASGGFLPTDPVSGASISFYM